MQTLTVMGILGEKYSFELYKNIFCPQKRGETLNGEIEYLTENNID